MGQSISLPCCLPSTRLSLVSLTVQSRLRPATASGKALGAEVPGAFSLVHRVAAALPFAIVRVRYTGRRGNSLHSNAGFLRKSPFNHVTAIALCNFPSFRDGTQRFTDPRVGKMSTQSTLGPWRAGESSRTLQELAHLDVSTLSLMLALYPHKAHVQRFGYCFTVLFCFFLLGVVFVPQ